MYWTTYRKLVTESVPYKINRTVAVDDKIYSMGGGFSSLIKVHVLNTNSLTWSLLPRPIGINGEPLEEPDVPVNRIGHTVVAYKKKIYLWGGKNDYEVITNTLYCFDTETLNWSTPQVTGTIPSPRFDHSSCISNHLIYIFGGYYWYEHKLSLDVYCLDLKTMNWSFIKTIGRKPSPRLYQATVIVDNRMYIHGGYDNIKHIFSTDTMYLDLESNQWHRLETTGNIPVGPNDRSLFVHNNIIYVLGGCQGFEDLYYFDTKRNHWDLIKPRGKSPEPNEAQSCVVVGDKLFFLSGDSLFPETNYEIHVLDFNPSLKTLAIVEIIENGLDSSCLPTKLRSEIDSMRQHLANI